MEVKKAKEKILEATRELNAKIEQHSDSTPLWNEFLPELLSITEVRTATVKIAGIAIPTVEQIIFNEMKFSLFERPQWFPEGLAFLRDVARVVSRLHFGKQKMMLLEHARRKTTQKVNLYEKVQIPAYEDAIRKIKRFLEDEENLSKSAQKIVKKRQQKQKEMQL